MEPLKLIIAGGRELNPTPEFIRSAILMLGINNQPGPPRDLVVVSGVGRGVDRAGEAFAKRYGYHVERFPAFWEVHGKKAGPLRNVQMAEYADELLLIWDGFSIGSGHMKKQMELRFKTVHEIRLRSVTMTTAERLFGDDT